MIKKKALPETAKGIAEGSTTANDMVRRTQGPLFNQTSSLALSSEQNPFRKSTKPKLIGLSHVGSTYIYPAVKTFVRDDI